ncbi:MAG: Abi family protein [Schwartzia sp. (in: firmicutes)]
MAYDKPFKTYQQQIRHLIDAYGLTISDTAFAEHALKTMSYYDLVNGYQDVMMMNGRYLPDISIEFLYTFHLFDKGFQNILFARIMFIENYFKSLLSHCIAENFGVHQGNYLDKKNYNHASSKIIFADVKRDIEKVYTQSYPPIPTRFYLQNHNHIPPWILFKNISFGSSINLFRVLKSPQKNAIANEIIPDATILQSEKIEFIVAGLNLIRKCRNLIAHNLKFVTFQGSPKDSLKPKILVALLPQELTMTDQRYPRLGNKDLYAVFLFIYQTLNTPYLRYLFVKDVSRYIVPPTDGNVALFPQYADITGIPHDLFDRCTKIIP